MALKKDEIRHMQKNDLCVNKSLEELRDCKYLLVSKIGIGATNMAKSLGIESYEIPGIIEESVEQLIKYIKIKKLFE